MRRRDFIRLVAGAALGWPAVAGAEQAEKVIRIGYLGPSLKAESTAALYKKLLSRLQQAGFVEGQNLTVDYERVDDPHGPFAAAAKLMRSSPNLIIAHGPEVALQAVVGASNSTPIVVIAINYDPIERGYIKSLAQPGGNITGVFYRQLELTAKEIELMAEAFPERRRLAILWDAISADQFRVAEQSAKSHSLETFSFRLENPPYDFPGTFKKLAESNAQMVLVLSSPYFTEHRKQIGDLEIQYRLPAMFIFKAYTEAGGLMSYGVNQSRMMQRVADYVVNILKGAKPTELPVEQGSTFEFVVNLKTAKAIGVTLPAAMLLRADEVIE